MKKTKRKKDVTIRTPVEERAHIVASLEAERKGLMTTTRWHARRKEYEEAGAAARAACIYGEVIDIVRTLPKEKWS